MLTKQGYRVLPAASGADALRLVEDWKETLDLLVTDVMMPKMGGRELADSLRAKRSDLKVLYVSGYTNDAIVKEGELEPGTDLLQKPFTGDKLAAKVREVLDGKLHSASTEVPTVPR